MTELAESQSSSAQSPQTTRYRIWSLTDAGRISATEMVSADSDAEVLARTSSKVERCAVEIWDGLRFVERFEPRE